ncbi:MAG TPA: hypothetical protein VGY55_15315 [Pirellulales bacterium]|jgi:hypothetical protein|nr:hypothetical protein [Pirellulales bacterium]
MKDKKTAPVIRICGRADSPAAYEIRNYLSRNVVSFKWVELADDGEEIVNSDSRLYAGRARTCRSADKHWVEHYPDRPSRLGLNCFSVRSTCPRKPSSLYRSRRSRKSSGSGQSRQSLPDAWRLTR